MFEKKEKKKKNLPARAAASQAAPGPATSTTASPHRHTREIKVQDDAHAHHAALETHTVHASCYHSLQSKCNLPGWGRVVQGVRRVVGQLHSTPLQYAGWFRGKL